MRALRAVSAILAAPAGLDAEQTAALHFLPAPMLQVHYPALRDQVEERLLIVEFESAKIHWNRRKAIGPVDV